MPQKAIIKGARELNMLNMLYAVLNNGYGWGFAPHQSCLLLLKSKFSSCLPGNSILLLFFKKKKKNQHNLILGNCNIHIKETYGGEALNSPLDPKKRSKEL
jgi:hypothetical protein